MSMSTITVNVDDSVERKFRRQVREHLGTGKGTLGRAITEALSMWVEDKAQQDLADELRLKMEKGYDMGKINYKSRDELYGRS